MRESRSIASILGSSVVPAAAVFVALTAGGADVDAAVSDEEGVRFFETEIRPLLVEHCIDCHGPGKSEGGLRLDRRDGLVRGTDAGSVLSPDQPAESRLLKAVRHELPDALMPKNGDRLSGEAIAVLTRWVEMGAPWGEESEASDGPTPEERGAAHWAFAPPVKPEPPEVRNPQWVRNDIDRFILAKLEAKGFRPAPEADRRALIRRLHADLIGLPPTLEEIEAFVSEPAPDAVDALVERLLASPHYGERWARYWLDIARYADTKGYVFQEERRYPYSYTYRDWVIRALNEDMPYDRFVTYQLAADHAAAEGDDSRHLAAMGFLTLGRRFLNRESLIIDDRIDVVTRGLMGLTVGCARCHDHKSDPIPTADYYSLYGVFASSTEPGDLPLLGAPEETPGYETFAAGLAEIEARRRTYQEDQWKAGRSVEHLAKVLDALAAAWHSDDDALDKSAGERDISGRLAGKWRGAIRGADPGSAVGGLFKPWLAAVDLPAEGFDEALGNLAGSMAEAPAGGESEGAAEAMASVLAVAKPATMAELNRVYAEVLAELLAEPDAAPAQAEAPQGSDDGAPPPRIGNAGLRETLRAGLNDQAREWPTSHTSDQFVRFYHRGQRERLKQIEAEIDAYRATADGAPARGMVLVDKPSPTDTPIFIRGNENRPGDVVPRRFLAVLSGSEREPFREGSGRAQLAEAIVDPANPLTARVLVNRVWMHHFGSPLVRTPSDFGVQTAEPLHRDLLDYLAVRFVEEGWSLKNLHRLILGSAVFRQASDAADPAVAAADPDNEHLARMNRRRLDFEGLRDAVLKRSGALDLTMGGKGVDIVADPDNARRSVYAFIERQNLPGLFRTFDFASPDTHSPARFETTVPQQALFMLNSPFMARQADRVVAGDEFKALERDEDRIAWLYRRILARHPDPVETEAALRFVGPSPENRESAVSSEPATGDGAEAAPARTEWSQLAQVLLCSNEFAFID